MIFTRTKNLKGSITVPGDKSISHRAVMFGALAEGLTEVEGFLPGADCLSTIDCFRRMGISIEEQNAARLLIHGKGLHGLKKPYSGYSGHRQQRHDHKTDFRHFKRAGL